jgi:hypothetical protein
MSTIKDTIIDLCYLNYSDEQIADYLIQNKISADHSRDSIILLIKDAVKEHSEELEADAYLSSMECYYDNYCEY